MLSKSELRKEVARKINEIEDRPERNKLLLEKFKNYISTRNELLNGYVLSYMPLPDEPDISGLHGLFNRLALPLIVGDGVMQARAVRDLSGDLVEGSYGILEPGRDTGVVEPSEISLIIVPGRAFTEEGARLGRGKGFYDRYLKRTSAIKIALAYREQIYPGIITEDNDVAMDIVLYV